MLHHNIMVLELFYHISYIEEGKRPIVYASCSLAPAEKNYLQIDKEALVIVLGVKHFHHICMAVLLLSSQIISLCSNYLEKKRDRNSYSYDLQCWALTSSAYDNGVQYVLEHTNANIFSRLPLPEQPKEVPMPQKLICLFERIETSLVTVTVDQLRTLTNCDPVLSQVCKFVQHGWPKSIDSAFYPYYLRKFKLSIQDNCLLWSNCIIVPKPGRSHLLTLLHEGHPGISKMKGLAHHYVWCPIIDNNLEAQV